MSADAPSWFTKAIATPYAEHTVEVQGCPVTTCAGEIRRTRARGSFHGGAAHAHWWSFLAPLLINHYSVIALDLSGHGDSGRVSCTPGASGRTRSWPSSGAAGFIGPPILVGTAWAGSSASSPQPCTADELAGAILVRRARSQAGPGEPGGESGAHFRNPKTYPDVATAQKHFRLVPPQPCDNRFILDFVAERSLRPPTAAFTWKFDPNVFTLVSARRCTSNLANVRCRVAMFRGEHSYVVPPETGE